MPIFDNSDMEVLCNICNCVRFRVLKPEKELPSDHWYFTCTECTRKKSREFNPEYNYYMKTGIWKGQKLDDLGSQ